MHALVATRDRVYLLDPDEGSFRESGGVEPRPTCLAAGRPDGRAWCGTEDGILVSDDGGRSWSAAGLAGHHVTAVTPSPTEPGAAWAGTEPSAVFRTGPGEAAWERARGLLDVPSSSSWSFPPRPETHHVRWIACHPEVSGRLWVAIEAGALVTTADGGASWRDRAAGSPRDTHEIAIHPDRPDTLRIAAGDGYFENADGGESWRTPDAGLGVGYLRSVAVDPADPDVVIVSGASAAKSAYAAGHSDGRVHRRAGDGRWERITAGWPEDPATIAPLLCAGGTPGGLWAADERGVHRSGDGGRSWHRAAPFPSTPAWLRGLAVVEGP